MKRALLPGDTPTGAAAARRWLTGTFAGRAFLLGAALKLLHFLLTSVAGPDLAIAAALDAAGAISLMTGGVAAAYRAFVLATRRVLWRVRRKLTLSYIFIGFVPALLIITFFLLSGLLLFFNVSSYLMQSRVRALVDQTHFLAQTAALEVQRAAAPSVQDMLERRQSGAVSRYPGASYAAVPVRKFCGDAAAGRTFAVDAAVAAGPWAHLPAPVALPDWIPCSGHAGLVAYHETIRRPDGTLRRGPTRLAVRAAALPDVRTPGYAIVVDVPLSPALARQMQGDTGIELGEITALTTSTTTVRPVDGLETAAAPPAGPAAPAPASLSRLEQPLEWVAFLDYTDWNTGQSSNVTVAIGMSIGEIYERISGTRIARIGNFNFGQLLLLLLSLVGGLFLVIQFVAFIMGLALARSITGSVHELFTGTERVRQGDFAHKIPIRTRDQLGELAESFNSMTASIEDLLRQKAEKERLEQELRIARDIQMSLLPQGQLSMPGLALTAHCEPAREVGGDYYDFLPLDEHRVGILIADVSGKGTSAALYMAELKGLMLSLTQLHSSPRRLLIDANRIISHHLDTRSFITMTYAIVDMQARTLTYARAGHCPLIYLPGPHAGSPRTQILTPDGMVLGLRLDDGAMFERLLEEQTVPLGPGDLFVLFTDGISEAMNGDDECFGEPRLAELIQEHGDLPFEELRERILREIHAFVGEASQHDDMTMLLLKVEEVGAPAV